LSRTDIASSDARISYAAFMRLIERAALLLEEPAYGLKLGARHDVRDNGFPGFIPANSPPPGDALANVDPPPASPTKEQTLPSNGLDRPAPLRFRDANPALRLGRLRDHSGRHRHPSRTY